MNENETNLTDLDTEDFFNELEGLFGESDAEMAQMEQVVLSQDLEGFASCFPDCDLHPPVK